MRFLDYLQEEWVARVKGHWSGTYSGLSDVFENPTPKELSGLQDDVRFFVNFKTKNLYVWNWNITHLDMASHLIKQDLIPTQDVGSPSFLKTCYAGTGMQYRGKIVDFRNSDCVYTGNLKLWAGWLFNKTDDSWTKRWFKDSLINLIKEQYEIS